MKLKKMSLREALAYGVTCLTDHGIADASADAWLLLEYVTGISRAAFLADPQEAMRETDVERYRELLEKRSGHIPLQYLTGEQEFMGFAFQVNEHVLIPRQDTETLAEEALARLRPGQRVLDLCTGSGCVAVSIAKLMAAGAGKVQMDASDISEKALSLARENAARLGAAVRFIRSDLFENIKDKYDMIVSNPPYIRTAEIEELSEEVRLHEPRLALDGKEDGLHFYRRIVHDCAACLKPGGWLLLEIGYDQGRAAEDILAAGGYTETAVIKDLAGNDRVAAGRRHDRQLRPADDRFTGGNHV